MKNSQTKEILADDQQADVPLLAEWSTGLPFAVVGEKSCILTKKDSQSKSKIKPGILGSQKKLNQKK